MYPTPLTTFNVGEYMVNESSSNSRMLFKIPQFKAATLSQQLTLTNTWGVPILLRGIINKNAELRIEYVTLLGGDNSVPLSSHLLIQPNETIQLAQINLYTSLLLVTQGPKFLSMHINNTLVPMSVMVYDKTLLCVWEEEFS